jgi:hypothetical protein
MFVLSADGVELGRIARFDDESFIVEKGTLTPRTLLVPYEDVDTIVGGRVSLNHRRAAYVGADPTEPAASKDETDAVARGELSSDELRGTPLEPS